MMSWSQDVVGSVHTVMLRRKESFLRFTKGKKDHSPVPCFTFGLPPSPPARAWGWSALSRSCAVVQTNAKERIHLVSSAIFTRISRRFPSARASRKGSWKSLAGSLAPFLGQSYRIHGVVYKLLSVHLVAISLPSTWRCHSQL